MEITGRITGDGQIKKLKDNRELVAFTIVLNNRYKTKDGQKKDDAVFINCSYWASTKIVSILKKGSIVTVNGSISVDAYKTNDGEYHAHLKFHCNYINLISSNKSVAVAGTAIATPEPVEDLPF